MATHRVAEINSTSYSNHIFPKLIAEKATKLQCLEVK